MKPMKPEEEEDIYDAVAKFREKHPENEDGSNEDGSMAALNGVMALLLKCDTETQTRIIRTLAVFFKVSLP